MVRAAIRSVRKELALRERAGDQTGQEQERHDEAYELMAHELFAAALNCGDPG
jgi:hypothetical protein